MLIRQRNYQQAGEIYEREATRLLSAGRRDELAAIYLEFADRFFDGTPSASHPGTIDRDYQHAAEFYQQAQSLHPSLEKEQQIALRIARCQQELKQLEAAIQAFRKFVADYGSEADAKRRARRSRSKSRPATAWDWSNLPRTSKPKPVKRGKTCSTDRPSASRKARCSPRRSSN